MGGQRCPRPVRGPLPVRRITLDDIQDAMNLTVAHLHDPEDPAFDPATFGAVCAARAALAECADVVAMAEAGRELEQESGVRTRTTGGG